MVTWPCYKYIYIVFWSYSMLCVRYLHPYENSNCRFKGTTDAVAAQFFLKNVHSQMRKAASTLFGKPGNFQSRPNTFGELMRATISPSKTVQEAVNWTLRGGPDPHITLHMRMLMNK